VTRPTFDEAATFAIAMIVLIGSFIGLLVVDGSNESRVIYGALIGSVATFYFQRSATKAATNHTIEAQNNGLDQIRQTVTRIEDGRKPSDAEAAARDGKH
jgi:hypothetical protein